MTQFISCRLRDLASSLPSDFLSAPFIMLHRKLQRDPGSSAQLGEEGEKRWANLTLPPSFLFVPRFSRVSGCDNETPFMGRRRRGPNRKSRNGKQIAEKAKVEKGV